MKINIISDIHISMNPRFLHQAKTQNNFGIFNPKKLEPADYLLIAGDLGTADNYESVYKEIKNQTVHFFKKVFFIRGNHDYWQRPNSDPCTNNSGLSNDRDNQFIIEHLDENTVLLGCTLWTPVLSNLTSESRSDLRRFMNDFTFIRGYSLEEHHGRYLEESAWLRDKCKQFADKKIIIMTHHGPRKELISPIYANSTINNAFFVTDGSCDDLHPAVWIYGHTHIQNDTIIDGTRYINNAIGYHSIDRFQIVPERPVTNWYNTVIEL